MRLDLRAAFLTPSLILFLGCLGMCDGNDLEGRNPGECADGADNDEDGDFDCDDADCTGSSDCDEGSHDTDAGSDDSEDQPDDSDPGLGEEGIDDVTVNVNAAEWHYDVLLSGFGDAVTLDITEYAGHPWEESHELVNTHSDPGGAWDRWEITLPITGDWLDQESGVNTLFQPEHEVTMVWRVKDFVGGQVVDCVVWAGDDADASLLMDSGCREIQP